MIFITVGTEKFQFDRLLKIVDDAVANGEIKDEVFAQIGRCQYQPRHFNYAPFIDFTKIMRHIKRADIVVSQAGVGTTLLSLALGKVPIIFPRQAAFKEHFDDHQVEFAKRMATAGKVIVAHDEKELIYKIKNYNKALGELNNLLAQLEPLITAKGANALIEYLRGICR